MTLEPNQLNLFGKVKSTPPSRAKQLVMSADAVLSGNPEYSLISNNSGKLNHHSKQGQPFK
ncbi:MAG: hypothetical protein RMX96_01520 [Nostoc sp. ChiSLP02]|nr:hypothetical protein [Nostoc sp. DedSLP05]MDZ8102919.1 hypothetical protein [Nostoc sp. DedSLP01]MDZ8183527.1 hypothetical protein [Nostoc sp. ChiSLP02]